MNVIQVRFDAIALHFMNGSQQLRKVPLDAAFLAELGTRWTKVRPLDASTADLRLDFFPIFREFRFGEHDMTPSRTMFQSFPVITIAMSISNRRAMCWKPAGARLPDNRARLRLGTQIGT
jgi:hypothetical protein